MNQKYLMGMASEGVQTIVFAAAAPNVAAFIQQNKAAPELTVCTLDYKMLLTARMDRIDACPDRAFSVNELRLSLCNADGFGTGCAIGCCAA